jgi:hypothetical protein
MNLLDENIREDQRQRLRGWRITVHQIGFDIGRKGMKDKTIITLLQQQTAPTFFTRDDDFYDRTSCHPRYCIAFLDVPHSEVAMFVRRFLRHSAFDTKAKRMGAVIRVLHSGLYVWRFNAEHEIRVEWSDIQAKR